MPNILGNPSDNNFIGTTLADLVLGFGGRDTLDGNDGNDQIFGLRGDDSLLGGSGNDFLYGGFNNDTLDGGLGRDFLAGGAGSDTYIVDSTTDTLVEGLSAGIDTVRSSISFTLGDNLDNLTLTGLEAINGTGNTLNNAIAGNSANNTLNGGAGNDSLDGGLGIDALIGGIGNDTYTVDSTTDSIIEDANAGTDIVRSSVSFRLGNNLENLALTGSEAINGRGNALNNAINGNSASNILNAGAGNDTLNGGGGTDTLSGGIGDDTYIVFAGSTNVRIIEEANAGIDIVESYISFTLGDNLENLRLRGESGTGNTLNNLIIGSSTRSTVYGLDGNDTLRGIGGNDTLYGGDGNDVLVGDFGNVLTGGAGEDKFLFDSNSISSTLPVTTINDFISGIDKIVLDKGIFAALTSVFGTGFSVASEFAVVGSNAVPANSSALIVYNSTNGNLFYNQNGVEAGFGTGARFATLVGSPLISATDFIIEP